MKNDPPITYKLYRVLWSIVHFVLVGFAVIAVAIWFIHNNEGVHLVMSIWGRIMDIQRTVANAIPFPWDRHWKL